MSRHASSADIPRMPWEIDGAYGRNVPSPESISSTEATDDTDESAPAATEGADEQAAIEGDELEISAEAGDAEDADEAEEVAEPEATAVPPKTVKVKVDGQEIEVTYDELLKGYSRTSDYTRKTQQLAQDKASASAVTQQYQQRLQMLEQALSEMHAEPDWDSLRDSNPQEYAVQYAEHHRRQQQIDAVRTEQARLQHAQMQEQHAQYEARLEEERNKLLAAIPDWRDAEKAKAGKAALYEYALGMGYSAEDLQHVSDHRVMIVLDKARRFDALQKRGAEAVQKSAPPSKTLTPGSAPAPKAKGQAAMKRDLNKLARTGRVDDAAAVFMRMLKSEQAAAKKKK